MFCNFSVAKGKQHKLSARPLTDNMTLTAAAVQQHSEHLDPISSSREQEKGGSDQPNSVTTASIPAFPLSDYGPLYLPGTTISSAGGFLTASAPLRPSITAVPSTRRNSTRPSLTPGFTDGSLHIAVTSTESLTRSAHSSTPFGTTTMTIQEADDAEVMGTDANNDGAGERSGAGGRDDHENRTLAIALSVVLSVLAVVLIAGSIFICCRYRQKRIPFLQRGVTPIDDEEIESWKKRDYVDVEEKMEPATDEKEPPTELKKHASTASLKKPAGVVVYQDAATPWAQSRVSEDVYSPASPVMSPAWGKSSMEVPPTPVLARAPNARPGLTDESVQGDEAFVMGPKRRPSRLTKYPPRGHGRNLSSRSSFSVNGTSRSQWFGQGGSGYHTDGEAAPPRHSHDQGYSSYYASQNSPTSPRSPRKVKSHSRVYSSPTVPPQISFDEELAGLSPRPAVQRFEIGRAVG